MEKGISPIKVLTLLQETLREINTGPLMEENLVIQQDALSRLMQEDIEDDSPFAVYTFVKIENDAAFPFTLELSRDFFFLGFTEITGFYCAYADFEDEKDISNQITLLLRILLNGQISLVLSVHKSRLVAVEILLYKDDRRTPVVISTNVDFPRFSWGESDVIVKKNSVQADFVEIPDNFFLYPKKDDGSYDIGGRDLKDNTEITPLTYRVWSTIAQQLFWKNKETIKEATSWGFFLKQWETWVIVVCVLGLYFYFESLGLLPSFLKEIPGLSTLISVTFIYWIVPKLLHHKIEQHSYEQTKVNQKMSRTLSRRALNTILFAISAISIILLLLPAVIEKGTGHVIPLLVLTNEYPVILVIPLGYTLAALLLLVTRKYFLRILAGCIYFFSYFLSMYMIYNVTDVEKDVAYPFIGDFVGYIIVYTWLILPIFGTMLFLVKPREDHAGFLTKDNDVHLKHEAQSRK